MNIKTPKTQLLVLLGLLVLTVGLCQSTFAALLAYEGFTNAPGDIVGMNGGAGWAEPWNTNSNPGGSSEVVADSLTYTDSLGNVLTVAGNKLYNHGTNGSSQPGRDMATVVGATNLTENTTVWLSFLGQRIGGRGPGGANSYERGANLSLFFTNTTDLLLLERLNVGENSGTSGGFTNDVWHFTEPNPTYRAFTTNSITNVSLVVVRIDFLTNDVASGNVTNDNIYIWVNPMLGVEPSTNNAGTNGLANGHDLAFNRIRMFAGGASGGSTIPAEWYFDELRIGGSYADVTPYTPGSGPNTTPTNILSSVSGGTLTLSWPSSHVGWTLQTQTNSRSVGLTMPTNTWFDVSGSASTNQVGVAIDPANPTVFYRLRLAQ